MERCKCCGEVVTEITKKGDKVRTFICSCQRKPMAYKDVVDCDVLEHRVEQLRAMHELMCQANDEDIYFCWIELMPDEPDEGDFVTVALDDEMYDECFDLFVRLIARKGNRY